MFRVKIYKYFYCPDRKNTVLSHKSALIAKFSKNKSQSRTKRWIGPYQFVIPLNEKSIGFKFSQVAIMIER